MNAHPWLIGQDPAPVVRGHWFDGVRIKRIGNAGESYDRVEPELTREHIYAGHVQVVGEEERAVPTVLYYNAERIFQNFVCPITILFRLRPEAEKFFSNDPVLHPIWIFLEEDNRNFPLDNHGKIVQ